MKEKGKPALSLKSKRKVSPSPSKKLHPITFHEFRERVMEEVKGDIIKKVKEASFTQRSKFFTEFAKDWEPGAIMYVSGLLSPLTYHELLLCQKRLDEILNPFNQVIADIKNEIGLP